MIKIKYLIYVGMFFLIIGQISALATISINIKPSFSINEEISFDYVLNSNQNEEISYFAGVSCPTAPHALLELKTINLKSNIAITESYSYLDLTKDIEPQTCNASVSIIEPYELIETKEFEIITNPSFDFNIKLNKKTFLQNQDIYLDYTSSIQTPSITATLTHPDQTTEQITLPTTIKAEQIGTYRLETTASKEGYKTVTKKEQFGVIKKQADIETIDTPDLNEFKSSDKTSQIDKDFKEDKSFKNNKFIIFLIFLIILIIIVFIILLSKILNKFIKK